jgi:hypothetical protein
MLELGFAPPSVQGSDKEKRRKYPAMQRLCCMLFAWVMIAVWVYNGVLVFKADVNWILDLKVADC